MVTAESFDRRALAAMRAGSLSRATSWKRPLRAGAVLWVLAAAAMLVAAPAWACLWDRDTLAIEQRHAQLEQDAIFGRFHRYPALYYQMRLERVTRELEASPTDPLALMDDAAVACDRLGDSDAAIAWMGRKRSLMDQPGLANYGPEELREHEYRYLANLGTFHAHRALARGEPQGDDMAQAAALIEAAVALNPDAHFGREQVQLHIIRWLLAPPADDSNHEGNQPRAREVLNAINAIPDFSLGLAGLVVLGNAWQSPLVFDLLKFTLQVDDEQGYLAQLARLRSEELVTGGAVRPSWPRHVYVSRDSVPAHRRESLHDYYLRGRAAAELWHTEWTAFAMNKLERGEHPDTHPDFWNGAPEPAHVWVPGERSLRGFIGTVASPNGLWMAAEDYWLYLVMLGAALAAALGMGMFRAKTRVG
jgi:hypothetical protein